MSDKPGEITTEQIEDDLFFAVQARAMRKVVADAIRARLEDLLAEVEAARQDLKYALQIIDAFHVEIRNDNRIPKGFCQGLIFVEWPEEIKCRLAAKEGR